MKKSVLLLLIFFLVISVSAENNHQYHLKLLAVQEEAGGYIGSDADLYLELKEGSGRVFLETTPLTKFDTQISTKFAKEIACKHYKLNCDESDFIYTIKAKSNIIGGPSAGAAIAALTAIAVMDLNYDEKITITGTINSGGMVGSVGGVKEKLEAAAKVGLKTVLVAIGSAQQLSEKNNSILNETSSENESEDGYIDRSELEDESAVNKSKSSSIFFFQNNSIEVVEVADLDDVITYLTGKKFNDKKVEMVENPQYTEIMGELKDLLCERTAEIELLIKMNGLMINDTLKDDLKVRKESAENSSKVGDDYSAASFCFSSNIDLKSFYYRESGLTSGKLTKLATTLQKEVIGLQEKLNQEQIKTITDLQTLMIVKERINDVQKNIDLFSELRSSALDKSVYALAYAEERFFSAVSWMKFFAMDGKKFVLNGELLKSSCEQKISESKERYQYVNLFFVGFNLLNINEKIVMAEEAFSTDEYELCLIMATQAKADANAILNSMELNDDTFTNFLTNKIEVVGRIISESSTEGTFPILGYSYYQYANSLKEENKYTALVFLEYALEMSDLSIYFPEEKDILNLLKERFKFDFDWVSFIIGLATTGIIVIFLKKK